MGSPVCGLRPIRALRWAFTRRPRPGTTNTPFFLVSFTAVSTRCSMNAAAVLLLVSSFSARWRTSWVLVIPEAMLPPVRNVLICCGDWHLISAFLWKNSVFSAFYAVFFKWEPEKPTNMALFALTEFELPVFSGVRRPLRQGRQVVAAWDNGSRRA